jgi:hypothetical protein
MLVITQSVCARAVLVAGIDRPVTEALCHGNIRRREISCITALRCYIIDHPGRKRSLLSGILIQLVAMLYIAIFLTV